MSFLKKYILLIVVLGISCTRAIQIREEPSGASGAADPNEDEFPMDFKGKKSPAQVMIDTLGKVVLDMRNDQKKDEEIYKKLMEGAKRN